MQNDLVLLHGWGMNRDVWQLLMPELTFAYEGKVKSLDLSGFGTAPLIEPPYTLHRACEQIASQLSEQSVLVGWSLGGLCALYIAKHWAEKVSKVILVASSPCFITKLNWQGIKPEVLDDFTQQLVTHSDKTVARFLAIQAMGSESAKADVKQLKQLMEQSPPPSELALKAGLEILKQQDFRHTFSQLTQPIAGIFGRLDALVPYKTVRKMQQLHPNFEIAVIDKASHAPFISHKNEFLAALKSML